MFKQAISYKETANVEPYWVFTKFYWLFYG